MVHCTSRAKKESRFIRINQYYATKKNPDYTPGSDFEDPFLFNVLLENLKKIKIAGLGKFVDIDRNTKARKTIDGKLKIRRKYEGAESTFSKDEFAIIKKYFELV